MSGFSGVDVGDIRALLRAFQLECEGVSDDTKRLPLPSAVAGFFWPDEQQPDREADGRAPLGGVLLRIRREVDTCSRLGEDERLLLSRRHGLGGAVRRLTTSTSAGGLLSDAGTLRPVDIAHARTTLHRAYWHLAQTLPARPDDRPTVCPTPRADPIGAPWFVRHGLSRNDETTRLVVIVALDVARQWCAVGGSRQDSLYRDLSCWHDCFVGGRKSVNVVNLRRRLSRANAYVGMALSWIIATPGLLDVLRSPEFWKTSELPAPGLIRLLPALDPYRAPAAPTDVTLDTPVQVDLATWIQGALQHGVRVGRRALASSRAQHDRSK